MQVVVMKLLLCSIETYQVQMSQPLWLLWLTVCIVGSIVTLTILRVQED